MQLNDTQHKILFSKHRKIIICGCYASGKTFSAISKVVLENKQAYLVVPCEMEPVYENIFIGLLSKFRDNFTIINYNQEEEITETKDYIILEDFDIVPDFVAKRFYPIAEHFSENLIVTSSPIITKDCYLDKIRSDIKTYHLKLKENHFITSDYEDHLRYYMKDTLSKKQYKKFIEGHFVIK